jgi:TPR repeat protein
MAMLNLPARTVPLPEFVEQAPWETGFAQIFAREVAPQLAQLEWQRRLTAAALDAMVLVGVVGSLVLVAATRHLPRGTVPPAWPVVLPWVLLVVPGLLGRRFWAREERGFLPAVCRHFGSLDVEIAPKGLSIHELDPFRRLGLIPQPGGGFRLLRLVGVVSADLRLQELFVGERHGIDLALAAIEVVEWFGPFPSNKSLFCGDVLELYLPNPGPAEQYPPWRFDTASLPKTEPSTVERDLRTPQVLEALAQLGSAFDAQTMTGAVADNRLYIALSSARIGRVARLALHTPVSRCEPTIRIALAQIAAVLRLADACAAAIGAVRDPSAAPIAAAAAAPASPAAPPVRKARAGLRLGVIILTAIAAGIAILWLAVPYQARYRIGAVRTAAEHGDATAQNKMGQFYQRAGNYREAARWYRMAAEGGYAEAQQHLGWQYENGRGVARDYEAAMHWSRLAAEQGNAPAQWEVGWLYQNGLGVPRDYPAAIGWFRRAADRGYSPAMYSIALFHSEGWGVVRDYGAAMQWYRKAADRGNVGSYYGIAVLYEEGAGVARDYDAALGWYRKAANDGAAPYRRGYPAADHRIAELFRHGKGVRKDAQEALRWYRLAAQWRYAPAEARLGAAYDEGWGVGHDDAVALRWYREAAGGGNGGVYGMYATVLRRAIAEAVRVSEYRIGLFYERGRGVTRDLNEARAWMQKAADAGMPEAKDWLAANP